MIIGSPGAGKSTFARKLKEMTGLPLYYLDMLWHKADRTNVSTEEFDKALQEIVQQDKWIIDGNYQRTLEIRLQECDTVFLWIFRWQFVFWVQNHVLAKIGKTCRGLKQNLMKSLNNGF